MNRANFAKKGCIAALLEMMWEYYWIPVLPWVEGVCVRVCVCVCVGVGVFV